MLPSLVARAIEEGLQSYIRNEFVIAPSEGFRDEAGRSPLDVFLDAPHALTKGPWLELSLPFKQGGDKAPPFTHLPLAKIKPGFRPYRHQQDAFERLAWANSRSTIVATGTGSGKTECFLLPILDWCLACGKPGIKAILIYPMNALATDQSRRIESLLESIEKATGRRLRAGLYTGESAKAAFGKAPDAPASPWLIEERAEIRRNPPDILLTNYKMLDFLLMRPEDQGFWEGNGPEVMKYLVVDELHTFDGAQGTDLSCLIRRLRDRLHLGDALTAVGTSATIGGSDSIPTLCRYASDIFATAFEPKSVIEEDRLSAQELLDGFGPVAPEGRWPSPEILEAANAGSPEEYFAKVIPLWFDGTLGFSAERWSDNERLELGRTLGQHLPALAGFRRLVEDVRGVTELSDLADRWMRVDEIMEAGRWCDDPRRYVEAVIDSLVAMVAFARNDAKRPFLNVRAQLWVRTLSRAVASVAKTPKLALAADLPSLTDPLSLPLVGCRDCSRVAWGAAIRGGVDSGDVRVKPDLSLFYQCWFSEHRDTALLYPVATEESFTAHRARVHRLCPKCGRLEGVGHLAWSDLARDAETPADAPDGSCACGGAKCERVLVWIPKTATPHQKDGATTYAFTNLCPCCGAVNSLRIFGAASASLSAAALDHLHASPFAGDSKVIAFSDSVQDAALRAGFFNARDFLPVCRHALVSFLRTKVEDQPLKDVLFNLPSYWEGRFAERFRDCEDGTRALRKSAAFLSTFIAPDKEWRPGWKAFCGIAGLTAERSDAAGGVDDPEAFDRIWGRTFRGMRERLVWEAMMEFGLRSENGRTVERTRTAVAYPLPRLIRQAARALLPVLEKDFGIRLEEREALHFVTGLVNRIRLAGAWSVRGFGKSGFRELEDRFSEYLRTGDSFRAFNMSDFLPTFGQHYRAPSAVTLLPARRRDDDFNVPLLSGPSAPETWFEAWLGKSLAGSLPERSVKLSPGEREDLLKKTFEVLDRVALTARIARKDADNPAWMLPLEAWKVSQRVAVWRCAHCGRRFFSADNDETRELWDGMRCLTNACPGRLEKDDAARKRDARPLYAAPPVRVHAREHTALIGAEERHAIERSFREPDSPWSINLLSATSTLEMGIDIGDLSTVLLASMPPSQASFLQRIGRAGRRDGNALALTMVGKRAHDLYFWQDPAEMLSGGVTPPGVFLQAVAVLERQLVAFAIGRWTAANRAAAEAARKPLIPAHLSDAILNLSAEKADAFPLSFFEWVSNHSDDIVRGFLALFETAPGGSVLSREGSESLRRFVEGDLESSDKSAAAPERPSLVMRIRESIENARAEFEDLNRRIHELAKAMRALRRLPPDDRRDAEIAAIENQQEALKGIVSTSFKKKALFNFLTDEGLLPNYAFPEEGVSVHSVIIKRRGPASGGAGAESDAEQDPKRRREDDARSVDTFEFSRAASQAIHELAPGSRFYVNEHILRVDQLRVTSTSFEKWRFCADCPHAEPVDETRPAPQECPHCGNALFGDLGRVKTLLRAREITAVADGRTDRIDDRSDDRRVDAFRKQVLVESEDKDIVSAWRIGDERFAFGFEFLRDATIREINFGAAADNAEPFVAAGMKLPQSGFRICRCCGKIQRPFYRKGESVHDWGCKWRDKDPAPGENPWVEGLFLYREVRSEAVRIRIPVCDAFDASSADVGANSFIAALQLGLRKHFHGAVGHIALSVQTDPAREGGSGRNRCVVLYDTIPGGSGYLKELGRIDKSGRPAAMLELLHEALEAVSGCACAKDPERDGCCRCVYQYRDFSSRTMISRREAEEILRRICAFPEKDIKVISSVRSLPFSIESALEARLVKRLGRKFTLSSRPTKTGEMTYELAAPLTPEAREHWRNATGEDPGERMMWLLRMQVNVAGAAPSRPDFTLRPLSEVLAARRPELTAHVFTDGWEFHAGKLDEDARKRQSILNEGHRVWSISWSDLARDEAEEDGGDADAPATAGDVLSFAQGLDQARDYWPKLFGRDFPQPAGKDRKCFGEAAMNRLLTPRSTNFEWLVDWLSDPFGFETGMREAVRFAALTLELHSAKDILLRNGALPAEWPRPLLAAQPEAGERKLWLRDPSPALGFAFAATFGARVDPRTNAKEPVLAAAIRIDSEPFSGPALTGSAAKRDLWAAFWQSANALQFAGRAWITTTAVESEAIFTQFFTPEVGTVAPTGVATDGLEADWTEILDELGSDEAFFGNLLPAAQAAAGRRLPAPDDIVDGVPGAILTDGQGLAWKAGGLRVFLFAAEDLIDPAAPLRAPEETASEGWIALTTAAPGWLDKLARHLAQAS